MNQIINALNQTLFNWNNQVTKKPNKRIKAQHLEPIAEKNLYTVLGFKSEEDFENKINKLVSKEMWQLFVDILEKEIGYAANKEVVKNIICNIAKSHRGNAFIKTEHIILNEKQGSKKGEKAIKKAINILREMYPEKALGELSIMKKQAEGFLQSQSDLYKAQSKQLQGFAPSGAKLFEKTLQYIKSLEKLSGVKKDELVKDFLTSHVKSQGNIEDAIEISNSRLREAYNKGMASYKECKNQSEIKELKEDIDSIDELMKNLIESTDDIVKSKEAILNCKDLQSSYIKEKEEHPFRGTSCQKMIDIYQRRIAEHQEKTDQSLNQINKLFKSMPQKIRELPDVKEFQEIMDDLQKKSNTQEAGEKFDSALICLSNIQRNLAVQLEEMKDPSTKLRYSHINTKTEVTRL